MNEKQYTDKIVEQVLLLIQGAERELTRESIKEISEIQFQSLQITFSNPHGVVPNYDRIVEKIIAIHQAGTTVNSAIQFSDTQHEEWLDRKRDRIDNGLHWNAFRKYLSRKLSEDQLNEQNNSTDKILGYIEDPERIGRWHSRGLVIGDIQSGKTTNFIALSNKAIDAGYKAIVVLSGLHNNLRKQTQIRFEEGVSGWNTKPSQGNKSSYCGIATPPPEGVDPYSLKIGHLTTREDQGDLLINRESALKLGRECIYSVNKKNYRTLENLIKYFRTELEGIGNKEEVPFLLIDDESDNASIDTNKPDDDESSKINKLIRELLNLFPRNSYVAYTATPFANILIDPEGDDDLFPRNFIMTLGRPDNYIGALKVFGNINDDGEEDDTEAIEREVDYDWFINLDDAPFYSDWESFIPRRNHRDSLDHMNELPTSLREAIYSFIISIAIRNSRGDRFEHKTMLVHATRLKDLQNRLQVLIADFVDEIHASFAIPQLNSANEHLENIKLVFKNRYGEVPETLNDIMPELSESISSLKNHVYGINGDNKDVLDEDEYPNGLNSIRIGGDKLSRGLTLPGLVVSYFIRVSRMYDTLMQMGRWFGYRENYEDICQIYTTAQLYNYFGHVSNASESLRSRIFDMNRMNFKPTEYRQQIQSHPGTMLVTALNKQRYTREITLSFSKELVQLTSFNVSRKNNELLIQERNFKYVEDLMGKLSQVYNYTDKRGARVFSDVSSDETIRFIEKFEYSSESGTWHGRNIISYINEMNLKGELQNWSIAFQTSTKPAPESVPIKISTWEMRSNVRAGHKSALGIFSMSNRSLVSIGHEKFDFDNDSLNELSGKSRRDIRTARNKNNALLILYVVTPKTSDEILDPVCSLAISFPSSPNASGVSYIAGSGFDDFDEEE